MSNGGNGPVSVSLKYGIPGVLVTSGIALLAISAIRPEVFHVGMALLLLGILTYFFRQGFYLVGDLMEDSEKRYVESWEWGIVVGFVLGVFGLGIVVTWLFWPFLTL